MSTEEKMIMWSVILSCISIGMSIAQFFIR